MDDDWGTLVWLAMNKPECDAANWSPSVQALNLDEEVIPPPQLVSARSRQPERRNSP